MELGVDTGSKVRTMAGTKARGMAGRMRAKREAKRAERLHEENDLDALNKAAERPADITATPRGGLLRMATVAAVAYIFGTKVGHERYEQMRSWLSEIRDRIAESDSPDADEVITSSPGMGPRPNPLIESGIRRS